MEWLATWMISGAVMNDNHGIMEYAWKVLDKRANTLTRHTYYNKCRNAASANGLLYRSDGVIVPDISTCGGGILQKWSGGWNLTFGVVSKQSSYQRHTFSVMKKQFQPTFVAPANSRGGLHLVYRRCQAWKMSWRLKIWEKRKETKSSQCA